MHDEVIVALISTIGTIIVAFITSYFQRLPPRNEPDETATSIKELRKENQELKKELEEQKHDHHY